MCILDEDNKNNINKTNIIYHTNKESANKCRIDNLFDLYLTLPT